MVGKPDRVGEDGATALDEKLERATAGRETGGKNGPRFFGGIGKAGEPVGWAGPEDGSEKKIAGFGGRADLSGQPVKRGKGLDAANEFAEGVVVKATGEGEKREEFFFPSNENYRPVNYPGIIVEPDDRIRFLQMMISVGGGWEFALNKNYNARELLWIKQRMIV